MLKMKSGLLAMILVGGLGLTAPAEDAPKPAEPGSLIVIDSAGKEQKLKTWKFVAGIQRMSWLAPEKDEDKPAKEKPAAKGKAKKRLLVRPAAVGPEGLVVVDEMKIKFLPAVTTFVPLERLRSITFDSEKGTMTVRAATSAKPEEDVKLTCTTKYKNINKVILQAEVDKGDAGVAEMTYQGGTLKSNLKEIRFPEPKVPAEKAGRPAVVTTKDDMVVRTHKVSDLQPVYRLASGRDKLFPTLMFKKTLKLDVAKITKITNAVEDSKDLTVVWQVSQKGADDSTLTLIESTTINGGTATLVGLLGRVPAGYRLFPPLSIQAVAFDTTEEPKETKTEKPKEKEKKSEE